MEDSAEVAPLAPRVLFHHLVRGLTPQRDMATCYYSFHPSLRATSSDPNNPQAQTKLTDAE